MLKRSILNAMLCSTFVFGAALAQATTPAAAPAAAAPAAPVVDAKDACKDFAKDKAKFDACVKEKEAAAKSTKG